MTEATATTREPRVLQRVILPSDHDVHVLPLYAEEGRAYAAPPDEETERSSQTSAQSSAWSEFQAAAQREARSALRLEFHTENGEERPDRYRVAVRAGHHVSFGTYFNAFPASYWRRWSTVETVLLRIRVHGDATVVVYRSTAKGKSYPVETVYVDTDEPRRLEFSLPLKPFIDGGWYWFDVVAGDRDAVLEEADWAAYTDRVTPGRISIGITTFNRPEFCVDQLRNLARATDVLDVLDEIFIVDQGTKRVEDHPDFAEASKGLADRLRVIDQGNLGGSGGFSRVMDETARSGASDYTLLLDDDVVTEPEGILRAVAFADLARRPTIVGGHMFSLYDRTLLHAFGETVSPYRWWWGPAPHTKHGHDFARRGLRDTPWLHRRVDVDYNGWWMCLIPTQVVRTVGLSLPVFIKWDDAEYGLRARDAGFPTVSMPGVAVWHVTWDDKDDAVDWQAYFHERNRLVSGLLHSPYERGGRLVKESFDTVLKHCASMQYSTAEVVLLAIEDVLDGPDRMHADLGRKLGELRELRARFDDARLADDLDRFPPVRRHKPPRKGKMPTAPKGRVAALKKAALGLTRQTLPVRDLARHHPEMTVPHQDAKWWMLSNVDSALVSSAEGTGAAWYKRDPQRFRSLLQRSVALHARLMREWPGLRERYRVAAPELTSPERWRQTFEASRTPDCSPGA